MAVKLSEAALILCTSWPESNRFIGSSFFCLSDPPADHTDASGVIRSPPPPTRSCLMSQSIPSAVPCCFFYYRHYLNRQVEQRRHLDDKPSITSASQRPWLHTSGLNEPGRRFGAAKHKCTPYLQCLTGRLWRRPKSTVHLVLGAARRGGWR